VNYYGQWIYANADDRCWQASGTDLATGLAHVSVSPVFSGHYSNATGGDDHDHDHDHGHAHHHDHDHPHAAIEDHDSFTEFHLLEQAIRELVIETGVLSAAEIQRQIELQESRTPVAGSRIVARAWTDPDFKEALLADPKAALAIDPSGRVRLGPDVGPTFGIVTSATIDQLTGLPLMGVTNVVVSLGGPMAPGPAVPVVGAVPVPPAPEPPAR
jgi:hypothetical protein